MLSFLFYLQILISVLIIIFVLLQQTEQDSLSGIGAGASQKMLSKRSTSTPISKATMVLFVLFMLNSLLLATISARKSSNKSEVERFATEQAKEEKPTIEDLKGATDLLKLPNVK
ncbi:MAG: preprotein translocase subunit SecG [Rickettsiales bacterium]|jgi:protein translocase SecG subunit|nr:preprotein translocase subunit SecG [Rickettsiales bacterium]